MREGTKEAWISSAQHSIGRRDLRTNIEVVSFFFWEKWIIWRDLAVPSTICKVRHGEMLADLGDSREGRKRAGY